MKSHRIAVTGAGDQRLCKMTICKHFGQIIPELKDSGIFSLFNRFIESFGQL